MRTTNHVRNVSIAFGAIMVGTLAIAAAAPWSKVTTRQQGRKSTDPPVAAHGKYGQDLFLAVDHRDLTSVQALLKKGADPDSRNGLEFTPLFLAAASFQPDAMQALIKAGAKVDAGSSYGTPLTFAAASGNTPGVQLLLSLGANVNTTRTDGLTVLMMAANTGSPEIVTELLKRHADVSARDEGGATALALAARNGHEKVVRMLLDAGATVDEADAEGRTPLMAAAANGHADCVRDLLEKGAKTSSVDKQGRTALLLAAEYSGEGDVIQALMKAGANPKTADFHGRTAAACAAVRGHTAAEHLLGKPSPKELALARSERTPHEAARISLKAIQGSMREFTRLTNCVSCHQEGLGRVATGEALARGFTLDTRVEQAATGRVNGALGAMQPLHEQALKNPEMMKQLPLIEINEIADTYSWLLTGMVAHKQAPNASTTAMARVLGRQQLPDGHWSFSIPRVPMQSSNITITALAVHSLGAYGPKSDLAETAGRIRRAKGWLQHAPVANSEDRASRLLGLKWGGCRAAELQESTAAIRADQHPDGGWSQLPGGRSDAYATGQALYALRVGGGVSSTDSAYQRGVKYLLRTQDADGSWFVTKRATPANNYFDGGFPHGESQYASFNGTCWATLALLETIPTK